MDKLNRDIDETRMNQNKAKTIDFVMDEIKPVARKSFKLNRKMILSMSLSVFLVLFMFTLNTGKDNPDNPGIVLNAASVERVSEATYITGNLLASEILLESHTLRFLADEDVFDFENDIDEFNAYFDVLKVFLDEDPIDTPIITEYNGEAYQNSIRYHVEGTAYLFNLNYDGTNVDGELIINNIRYQVSGTITETDDDTEVDLESRSGSNYINLKYTKQLDVESETKYEIESSINGVQREKEIKVTIGATESKVEIHENENEYSLKKEMEGNQVKYKLEYSIGEIEGEAEITERTVNGEKQYTYSIDEDGKHKEINKQNPNHFGQDDDDEDDDDDQDGVHNGSGNN